MTFCPFWELESSRITASSECAIAFRDEFPLTDGHTLVVPRQHIHSVYALPAEAHADLWALVMEVRRSLAKELNVNAFNIGVNDGIVAGQTSSMHTFTSFLDGPVTLTTLGAEFAT